MLPCPVQNQNVLTHASTPGTMICISPTEKKFGVGAENNFANFQVTASSVT
jgi:hypothetical protein